MGASAGVVTSVAAALPTHCTSLAGLAFTIPRLLYVNYKRYRAAKELGKRGVRKLKYTVGDVVVPLATSAMTAAWAGLADGAHAAAEHATTAAQALHHGATHAAVSLNFLICVLERSEPGARRLT